MSMFSKRSIQRSKTLGDRLKKVRQESGISLEEVEQATQIRKKYLEALEQGNYSILPGPLYIESFLKKYAEFLKVSGDFVLNLYRQQDKKVIKKKYQSGLLLPEPRLPKEVISPKLIRNLIVVMVILACLAYFGYEVIKIFSPPNLVVSNPPDFVTISQSSIEVEGETEPEALLTINDRKVFLDEEGGFSELVNLNKGLNVITVSAAKKRSKPAVITLHIFFKESMEE